MNDALAALAAQSCSPNASKLADAELAAHLAVLRGWARVGVALEKEFRFPDFARTIAFVNEVAALAERCDHHPDLGVHYGRCTVAWSTHSAGGITMNDVICAAKVEGLSS